MTLSAVQRAAVAGGLSCPQILPRILLVVHGINIDCHQECHISISAGFHVGPGIW